MVGIISDTIRRRICELSRLITKTILIWLFFTELNYPVFRTQKDGRDHPFTIEIRFYHNLPKYRHQRNTFLWEFVPQLSNQDDCQLPPWLLYHLPFLTIHQ